MTIEMRWGPDTIWRELSHPGPGPSAVQFDFQHVPCWEVVHQEGLMESLQASGRPTASVDFLLTSEPGGWRRGLAWYDLRRINGQPYLSGLGRDHGGCKGDGVDPFREFTK